MEEYMGEPKEFNKIRLTFELPEELHIFKEENGPQPFSISKEYTLSMNEKANLRKLVEGIIGKSMVDGEADMFDVESLVGKVCLLTVKHVTSKAGNLRSEIATATPLMKNQVCPDQINESKILSFDNWNEDIFVNLPDFIKDKIKSSKEYKALKNEIPF